MSIREDMAATFMGLASNAPSVEESQRLAMLAGNGIARPMAGLRARQTQREFERLAKRLPKDHPRRVAALAKAQAAGLQLKAVDAEIERLSVEPKPVGPEETGVHGYVRQNGKPVSGVDVVLVKAADGANGDQSAGHPVASFETNEDGMFAIAAPSPGPLSLRVQAKRTVLYDDPEALYSATGASTYRIIDLPRKGKPGDTDGKDEEKEKEKEDGKDGSKKPDDRLIEKDTKPPKQPDPAPKQPDRILTADIKGRTLHNALETLKERGIGVTSVRLKRGDVSTPEVVAVENASGEPSVILHVAASDRPSARLDAMAALLAHDKEAAETPLETVTGAREWLRTHDIGNLGDFASWSDKTAKRLQVDARLKQADSAARLKRILGRTHRLMKEE